jgi:hypothetical protein
MVALFDDVLPILIAPDSGSANEPANDTTTASGVGVTAVPEDPIASPHSPVHIGMRGPHLLELTMTVVAGESYELRFTSDINTPEDEWELYGTIEAESDHVSSMLLSRTEDQRFFRMDRVSGQ